MHFVVRAGVPLARARYEHDDPRSGAIACERPATADRLKTVTWLVEPLAPVGVEDPAGAGID